MSVKEESDQVNKILLQSLYKLNTQIKKAHVNSDFKTLHDDAYSDGNKSPKIEIVEHIKTEYGNYEELSNPDTLSENLTRFTSKLLELQSIYKSQNAEDDTSFSGDGVDVNVPVELNNTPSISNYFVTYLSNVTEQVCNLINVYRTEENSNKNKQIRKCLLKIKKKIQSIPSKIQSIGNEHINSSDSVSSSINSENNYVNAPNNISQKIVKLNKKLKKLSSVYVKYTNKIANQETEDLSMDKKKENPLELGSKRNHNDDRRETLSKKIKREHETSITSLNNNEIKINEHTYLFHQANVENIKNNSSDKNYLPILNSNLHEELQSTKINHQKKRKRKERQIEENPNDEITTEIYSQDHLKNNKDHLQLKKERHSNEINIENNQNNNNNVTQEMDLHNQTEIKEEISPMKRKKHIKENNIEINQNNKENKNDGTIEVKKKKKHSKERKIEENQSNDENFAITLEENAQDQLQNNENDYTKKKKEKLKKNSTKKLSMKYNESMISGKEIEVHSLLDNFSENINTESENINEEQEQNIHITENFECIPQTFQDNTMKNLEEDVYEDIMSNDGGEEDNPFTTVQVLLDETEEKKHLPPDIVEKLAKLVILIPHSIPPSHLIETRLVIGPTRKQHALLKPYNMKGGPYSRKEDTIIKRNFENFCKTHDFDLDAEPFLLLQRCKKRIMPHNERKKFAQFLGRDLPHRMLNSIYRRFRRLYSKTKNGRFSKYEDDLILTHIKYIREGQPKFSPLSLILNRASRAMECRYKVLRENFPTTEDNGPIKCIKWTMALKEEMIRHLMEEANVQDIESLRHVQITNKLWSKIGQKMNLHPIKMKIHWHAKLYTQLFSPEEIIWDRIRKKLIKTLYEMEVDDWKTMNWQELESDFPGISGHFLWMILKNTMRHNIPPKYWNNLGKCVKYLYENFPHSDENFVKARYLTRLKLNHHGRLEAYN